MTTALISEHPEAARRSRERTEHRPASAPTVGALRAQSQEAMAHLVRLLGYPPHWADELEGRAFATGRIWTATPLGEDRHAG